MITDKLPICVDCKHFNEGFICPAFKLEGIPEEILLGENDHKTPLEDQKNDITFTPIDE